MFLVYIMKTNEAKRCKSFTPFEWNLDKGHVTNPMNSLQEVLMAIFLFIAVILNTQGT